MKKNSQLKSITEGHTARNSRIRKLARRGFCKILSPGKNYVKLLNYDKQLDYKKF